MAANKEYRIHHPSTLFIKILFPLYCFFAFQVKLFSNPPAYPTDSVAHLESLISNYWLEKPDSTLICFDKIIKICERTNDKKSLAIAYRREGNFFFYSNYFEKVMEFYLKSIRLCEETNYEEGKATCLDNMGNLLNARNELLFNENDYRSSIKYQKEALNMRIKTKDPTQIANSFTNLGNTYMTGKDFDSADTCFSNAMKLYLKLNNSDGIVISLLNLGELNFKLGISKNNSVYFEKAIPYYKNCIDSCGLQKDSLRPCYVLCLLDLGKISAHLGQKQAAIDYFMKGLATAEKMKRKDLIRSFYKELADVYSSILQFDKAYFYQTIYATIKDSILNAENNKMISNLHIIYDTERKEKEIADQQILIKKQEFRFIALLAIAISVITIIILIVVLFYNRYIMKQKTALNQVRLKAVIDTQEQERKRIAKDLHDSVGQLLFILKMNLEKAGKEESKGSATGFSTIQASVKTLDEANMELRNIALQMMPRVLSELGIQGAISDLLSNTQKAIGLKCNLESHSLEKGIDETIQISVFRIFQEILSNILKYAGATEINVNLYTVNKQLILITEDNGIGFEFDFKSAGHLPRKTESSGMGLLNMATRAEALNGTILFEPSPNKGTITTVRVPISG